VTGTVVESLHPDFAVGDAVTGTLGVTEYALTDGTGVRKIDTSVAGPATWLGALGMPGLTAYHGLYEVGEMKPGETVLVSAAAGAVGSVAGQLAKAKGCTVIGIAGGPEKCAWLEELGFDATIDYKNDDVLTRLRELAPKGIDIYFDNVGGDILDAALANLRRGARIIICGAIASYNDEKLPPGPSRYMSLLVFRARMQGFLVFDYPDKDAAALADLAGLVSSGRLVARETVVEGGVEDFGRTLLGLFEGRNTGKLVLRIG
jgi:NADPH-dependent curcumin reductase CurA